MAEQFGQVVLDRDDWRRFQTAVRRSTDVDLPKRLGAANKKVGERFIEQWLEPKPDPAAVGEGTGAAVRPSASKREVQLKVGGKHRAGHSPEQPWGKRLTGPTAGAPARPFIRGSVDRHETEIRDMWLHAISEAMQPAFHKTKP